MHCGIGVYLSVRFMHCPSAVLISTSLRLPFDYAQGAAQGSTQGVALGVAQCSVAHRKALQYDIRFI